MSKPTMTAPTTGADETLRAAIEEAIDRHANDRGDWLGRSWSKAFASVAVTTINDHGYVPATAVPDAELRAIADWRSQHNDDMWELFDYIEAGIDEETDVAQRYVMRERFDELRALLEARHLAAGDAARTEEGETPIDHPA